MWNISLHQSPPFLIFSDERLQGKCTPTYRSCVAESENAAAGGGALSRFSSNCIESKFIVLGIKISGRLRRWLLLRAQWVGRAPARPHQGWETKIFTDEMLVSKEPVVLCEWVCVLLVRDLLE
jgi:hypothetical protein